VTNKPYWAAEPNVADFVKRALKRRNRYLRTLSATGRAERMRRSWRAYYGYSPDGESDASALVRAGDDGEVIKVTPNQYATLLRQTYVRMVSKRPAFKAVSTNSDYSSIVQTTMADDLIGFYDRKVAATEREDEVAFVALLLGEAWKVDSWDKSLGKPAAATEDGQIVNEGDISLRVASPINVFYDPRLPNKESLSWFGYRYVCNKYELAASYPAIADEILKRTLKQPELDIGFQFGGSLQTETEDEDDVWVYEVRHLKTPALPNGRLVLFLDSECVLFDSASTPAPGNVYPYEELHANAVVAEKQPGSLIGHTPFFDLLSLQELVDMTASISASAVNAGGLMNLWMPPGADPVVEQVASGLNIIKSPVKPEAIGTVVVPPAVLQLGEYAERMMRSRVAINELAATGRPSSGMPAQLAALMEAQTEEFHSEIEKSYKSFVEKSRTGMLRLLKRFGNTVRVAEIAGKNNTYKLQEWSKEDLAGVERFTVEETGNALRSISGRMAAADQLIQRGAIDGAQYLQLWSTGRIENLYEGRQANDARVEAEKELLRMGVGLPPVDLAASQATGAPQFVADGKTYVNPLISDTHWSDIKAALDVINTPEARKNAAVTKAVLEVISRRLELWQQQPPALTMLLGGVPYPQPMMPPMPPAQSATPPPKSGASNSTGLPRSEEPPLPKPPDNPITGEKSAPLQME